MLNIQRILTATDFSETSSRAESRAAILCKELPIKGLALLAVKRFGLSALLRRLLGYRQADQELALIQRAQQALSKACQRLLHNYGITCKPVARVGNPVSELLITSETQAADMLILGDTQSNFFSQFVRNDLDKLICKSRRPVLIVRNAAKSSYRTVLVPVDFSPESLQAAKLARHIAPHAQIIFLHAFSVWHEGKLRNADVRDGVIRQYRTVYREQAILQMDQFIEELDHSSEQVTRIVRLGPAVQVIAAYARKIEPDLIVMGRHAGSRLEEFLNGSVTRRTLHFTTSDILISSSAIS